MLLCGGVGDDSFVGGDVSVEVEVVVATVSRERWFFSGRCGSVWFQASGYGLVKGCC